MVNNKLKIVNDFGITPTTSYTAAGLDFYIPKLSDLSTDKRAIAVEAFKKSFNVSDEDMNKLFDYFSHELTARIGADKAPYLIEDAIHLFLGLDCPNSRRKSTDLETKVSFFCNERMVYEDGKLGMKLDFGDHIKINSGIKEALPHSYAGIFFNKSGRGTGGLDVRACVVDEDYTGYVHLSLAYTKDVDLYKVFAGDKITQQVILPIYLVDKCEEIDKDEYDEIMKDSNRGDAGFGSTDNVKNVK